MTIFIVLRDVVNGVVGMSTKTILLIFLNYIPHDDARTGNYCCMASWPLSYLRTWLANIRHVRIRNFTYIRSLTYGDIRCTLHGTLAFYAKLNFW